MKKLLPLLTGLLVASVAVESAGQTSAFRNTTGLLDIPCLALYQNGSAVVQSGSQATYRVQLRAQSAQEFSLSQLAPVPIEEDCAARFDTATNLYTDNVNVGDNSYEVSLKRGANNTFALTTYKYRGPASTSLWAVSHGANTVYLAGTVHLLTPNDYPLPRAFDEAYAKASTLWFEIDMDNPAETGENLTTAEALAIVRDPEGKLLRNVLTPTNYADLGNFLLNWSIPIANVEQWSAQMIISTFASLRMKETFGYSASGVDKFFADKAKADKKNIHGLETSGSQYKVLQGMNEGNENEMVREAVEELTNGKALEDLNTTVAQWRLGDTSALYRSSIKQLREERYQDYVALAVNRNNAWLPQVEAMLTTSETEMVLVGVAHLAGSDGLITLLRNRGYTVQKY